MKVGDYVKVDGVDNSDWTHKWIGICVWTDGYKGEFLIDGELETWTRGDLEILGAEVISENR